AVLVPGGPRRGPGWRDRSQRGRATPGRWPGLRTFDLGPAILFCPADRPDRYAKALERADAIILDLEDAVAPAQRPAARRALLDNPLDPARVMVRVNATDTTDHEADLAAVAETNYHRIMVPKAEAGLQTFPGHDVIALCESAAGVLTAPEL